MTSSTLSPLADAPVEPDALAGQPLERIERDGVGYWLLGTAHVSRASVAAVEAMLERESFAAVAIELCEGRAQSMRDPEAFKQLDLFQMIRQGKTGMVAASLILSSFQKRLADQYGIEPGAEMQAAMLGAEQRKLPVWMIDREVGLTLARAWRNVGFWHRFGLFASLLASVFESAPVEETAIEELKQRDLLESAFREFARESPPLYDSLIGERDRFMAAQLRVKAAERMAAESANTALPQVLVVIGAGHLPGLAQQLRSQQDPPAALLARLSVKPAKSRWPKAVALGLVLLIFAAIGFSFYRNPNLGLAALRSWILLTGGLAALGAVIAAAHPLSVLVAFISAPLKPFRPGIPSGALSAMTEALLRRPRVLDFDQLREDLGHWSGWWKNRVARTLLNFFLVCLGTIAGEYIAGFKILKSLF